MARTVSCLISNVISTLKCRSVPVGFKLHSVVISYLIGHFLFFLVHRDRPFPVENLVIRKKPRVSKYLKYCYMSDIDRLHTSGFVIYRSNRFQQCPRWCPHLYCYRCLLYIYIYQVQEKLDIRFNQLHYSVTVNYTRTYNSMSVCK